MFIYCKHYETNYSLELLSLIKTRILIFRFRTNKCALKSVYKNQLQINNLIRYLDWDVF
jgi:hypothetical protein